MSVDGSKNPIYFKSARRLGIAFASIFNSMWFVRENENGTIEKKMRIPLDYSPKMHWYSRLKSRDSMTSDFSAAEISTYLPRMSYMMTGMSYNANRQKNPLNKMSRIQSDQLKYSQTMPAPYDIGMELVIYSKNTEDSLMILEQILPLFRPNINLKIKEIDTMDVYSDVTIKLNSVTPSDNYLEGFDDNRIVHWTLDMTIEGNIYPAFAEEKIIHTAIIEFQNSFLEPPKELVKVQVAANQTNPPDYDIENSTVSIDGPDGILPRS